MKKTTTVKKIREYAKDKTIKETAEYFECSYCYMCKIIREYNIQHIKKRAANKFLKNDNIQNVIKDYQNGMTLKELGVKYQKTKEGIRGALIRHGVYKQRWSGCKVPQFKKRLQEVTTKDKTEKELYELFKDIYPNENTFRQRLNTFNVPYKRVVCGRKS